MSDNISPKKGKKTRPSSGPQRKKYYTRLDHPCLAPEAREKARQDEIEDPKDPLAKHLPIQHLKNPPKYPPLKNLKREYFARKFVETGGNATEAYAQAYPDSSRVASTTSASDILRSPDVPIRISQILDDCGLTDLSLSHKLETLTEATKPFVFEETLTQIPDSPIRLEAIKTAFKLRGHFKDDSQSPQLSVSISVPSHLLDKLTQLAEANLDRRKIIDSRAS